LVAEDSPLKAKVFVDGQNDGGYTHLITCSPYIKEVFYNQDCSKRYKFVFDKTEWTDMDESNVNSKYGELGVISVCFYRAKFVRRIGPVGSDCKKLNLGHDLKQVKVFETKDNIDITFTTKFAEEEVFKKPKLSESETTLERIDKEPIAVLHINYRPVDWFIARGISVKQTLDDMSEFPDKLIDLDNIVIKQDPENGKDGDVPIKIEKDVPVKVEKGLHDDNPTKVVKGQSQVINKNKRKYCKTVETVE
jgi:hypothetical protein